MKIFSPLSSSILLALASAAHGAGYVTNFDSLVFESDLAGQDSWVLSGASQSSGVSYVNASPFPEGSGANAGQLGSEELTGGNTSALLSQPVSLGFNNAKFGVTTLIQDSSNTFPNRDRFGFTLRSGSQELFGLYFTPQEQTDTPNGVIIPRIDDVTWSNSTTGESTVFAQMTEGSYTTLDVTFTTLNINSVQFTLKSAGVTILTDTIDATGIGGETITSLGVVWELFDLNTAVEGRNSIYFDDLSLVPEPSSALLGLAGAVVAFGRRRRA